MQSHIDNDNLKQTNPNKDNGLKDTNIKISVIMMTKTIDS